MATHSFPETCSNARQMSLRVSASGNVPCSCRFDFLSKCELSSSYFLLFSTSLCRYCRVCKAVFKLFCEFVEVLIWLCSQLISSTRVSNSLVVLFLLGLRVKFDGLDRLTALSASMKTATSSADWQVIATGIARENTSIGLLE